MDDTSLSTPPTAERTPPPENSRGDRRRRAREILSTQHSRLDRLEGDLTERLQQVADEIARELSASGGEQAVAVAEAAHDARVTGLSQQVDLLRAELAARQEDLHRVMSEAEQARIERGTFEQELRVRDALVAEAQRRDEHTRVELAAAVEQLNDVQAQLAAARERQEELRREVTAEHNAAAEQLNELRGQHDGLAGKLSAALTRLAESDRTAAELEQARIEAGKLEQELRVREALLTEAQSQQEKGRVELAAAVEQLSDARALLAIARERQEELRREAAAAESAAETAQSAGTADHDSQLARLREALHAAQVENERLADQLREAPAGGGDAEEMKKLRNERDSLTKKLSAAEAKLKKASEQESDARSSDDLQRRFEMAVEDLREVKRVNAELEAKLKSRGGGTASSAVAAGGGMNWEAQKQRMLASLENDDRDDEESHVERESIEGTIRITDQVVEQKDQEIAELKRRLEEQSGGGTAEAAAVAELLDHDDVIRQEREKLLQAQAEWREKIGKAEIDISIERAKIARDRMQLEEKLQAYHSEQAHRLSDGATQTPDKPTRGRWLARLGLKELNDE